MSEMSEQREKNSLILLGQWDRMKCNDEKHIAIALDLLHTAIALREQPNQGWPTIHACLRDASAHLECARQYWTKEAMEEQAKLAKELFGDPNNPQAGGSCT